MKKILGFLLLLVFWPIIGAIVVQRDNVPRVYHHSHIAISVLGILTLAMTIFGMLFWNMPQLVAVSLVLIYEIEFAATLILMLDEQNEVSDEIV